MFCILLDGGETYHIDNSIPHGPSFESFGDDGDEHGDEDLDEGDIRHIDAYFEDPI